MADTAPSMEEMPPQPRGPEICITQQIAADRYDRSTFIKVSLRELLIFAIFFTCLCIVAFATVNTPMYYYTYVLKKMFSETKFKADDNLVYNLKEINTMAQLWGYLASVVVYSVDWNFWYSAYDKIQVTVAQDKNLLYDNRIIGRPRIRQVRVTNHSCEIPKEFKPIFKNCYGYFTYGNEKKSPIPYTPTGPTKTVKDTAWKYTDAKQTGSYSYSGSVATYSGGGYYHDLSQETGPDAALISSLKDDLWISRETRAVFVDLSTYNGNINTFCFTKIVFELPPTGGVITSTNFNTMKLIRYHGGIGTLVLVCEVMLFLFAIYFLAEEIIEILALRSAYFSSWWTLLDLTILILIISFLLIALIRGLAVKSSLVKLINTQNAYVSFDRLILIHNVFNYITALLVFFATLKFVRYLKINSVMNRLLGIINESAPALFGFAVIFFIIVFAFALLGHLLFGTEVLGFSSIFDSFFTLHLMLLGEVDFQELVNANRIIGPIYFCVYIFFIFFILLNMFLAILNERFWAKNKQIDLETEATVSDVLKQGLQRCMSIFGCGSLVDRWQQRDEDRKGFTRLKQLRQSLARSGFSDAEITAFFDKYEIDEESLAAENGEELIDKLKSDLQGLGLFDSTVQERIMNRIDTIENTLLGIHKKLDVINLRLRL